jgi:hypothetical protein
MVTSKPKARWLEITIHSLQASEPFWRNVLVFLLRSQWAFVLRQAAFGRTTCASLSMRFVAGVVVGAFGLYPKTNDAEVGEESSWLIGGGWAMKGSIRGINRYRARRDIGIF